MLHTFVKIHRGKHSVERRYGFAMGRDGGKDGGQTLLFIGLNQSFEIDGGERKIDTDELSIPCS